MEPKPTRKNNRLQGFDYSLPGRYFITFCTKGRKEILGTIPYVEDLNCANIILSDIGKKAEDSILSISSSYPSVFVDKYTIMPDHIHLLLRLEDNSPLISTVINQTKRKASASAGQSLWQAGFYDHIIRNESDYRETVQYIENNVKKRVMERDNL